MKTNLAIVSNYPRPTDLVSDADVAFADCVEAIKRTLTGLEKRSSARNTLRMYAYLVRQFMVDGAKECSRVHARTFEGEAIWALLKIMAFSKSHEAALEAAREIQSEYCRLLNAAGVN